MAIRLDVPAMQMLDIRRYGKGAESGQVARLERIGDSVWAWQFPADKPFRIRDLTHEREVVKVPMPFEQTGGLTAQTSKGHMDEKIIRLTFCGTPPGWGSIFGICRTLTFDTQTGALIGSVDEGDHRFPNPPGFQPRRASSHGLRIESFWREDSNLGPRPKRTPLCIHGAIKNVG